MSSLRTAGWWGTGRLVSLLVLTVAVPACTFEHRGNGGDEAEAPSEPADTVEEGQVLGAADDPSEAVLQLVRTFRDATAHGDLALALSLVDRDAFLVDELAADVGPEWSRGELLLAVRARLADHLQFQEDSVVVAFPGGLATVYSRLTLAPLEGGVADTDSLTGRMLHETVVLLPTSQGWRIRHLHRSILP